MVNDLEVRNVPFYHCGKYLHDTARIFIDGRSLGDILNEYEQEKLDCNLLELTFSPWLEWEYCDRFMEWILAKRTETVIPILLCDGDMDFTCWTVAARMRFDSKYAYMDEIGLVCNENKEDDRPYGILFLEDYTDEDWEKYGDNIALEKADSPAWHKWISENYQEEMFRRLKNYYYPFIQRRENLEIWCEPHYRFALGQYEDMLRFYAAHTPVSVPESDIPPSLRQK